MGRGEVGEGLGGMALSPGLDCLLCIVALDATDGPVAAPGAERGSCAARPDR
jgi:hypothetical protein